MVHPGGLSNGERSIWATLHKLQRNSVRTDPRLGKILDHLKIGDVSDEDVTAVLDED